MINRRGARLVGERHPPRRHRAGDRDRRQDRRLCDASAATARANCRSRARSTSSTCGRNIRASGSAAGCLPRRAQRLAESGLEGMVVWALEENDGALSFYAGAGGRDIAEGVEVFDQKALQEGRLRLGLSRRSARAPHSRADCVALAAAIGSAGPIQRTPAHAHRSHSRSARTRPKTSTSSSRCRSAASRSSTRWTRRPARCSSTASCTRSMRYPGNYGFVPHTLSGDGDPIDVLVCNTRALVPGCVINVRPIGVLVMEDNAGEDEKIIAVPSPKLTLRYENVSELHRPARDHAASRSQHFFEHYKDLEPGKWVKIGGWHDAATAKQMIVEAIERAARPASSPALSSPRRKAGIGSPTETRSSAPQAKSRACSSAILRACWLAFGLPVASTSPTAQPSRAAAGRPSRRPAPRSCCRLLGAVGDLRDGSWRRELPARSTFPMRHSILAPVELKAEKLSQAGARSPRAESRRTAIPGGRRNRGTPDSRDSRCRPDWPIRRRLPRPRRRPCSPSPCRGRYRRWRSRRPLRGTAKRQRRSGRNEPVHRQHSCHSRRMPA